MSNNDEPPKRSYTLDGRPVDDSAALPESWGRTAPRVGRVGDWNNEGRASPSGSRVAGLGDIVRAVPCSVEEADATRTVSPRAVARTRRAPSCMPAASARELPPSVRALTSAAWRCRTPTDRHAPTGQGVPAAMVAARAAWSRTSCSRR